MANYSCYLIDKNGNSVFYQNKPDLTKGDLYISVSQILSMQGAGDFLLTWVLKEFGGAIDPISAHKKYMETVSELGSKLHKWVEYNLKGLDYPEAELSEDMIPGITSWDDFRKEHDIELIDSERVLHSKRYRFGGTIDMRLKIDGKTYIADLKSGSVQSKAFIQLTAYKHMMKEMGLSDGTEELLVLGGKDSKNKMASGGKIVLHTLDSMFKGQATEEDMFIRLMCLRELWYQENLRSRKFEPVIKGMQEAIIDPMILRFKQAFEEHSIQAAKPKKKGKKK